jgi:hypothetical protein
MPAFCKSVSRFLAAGLTPWKRSRLTYAAALFYRTPQNSFCPVKRLRINFQCGTPLPPPCCCRSDRCALGGMNNPRHVVLGWTPRRRGIASLPPLRLDLLPPLPVVRLFPLGKKAFLTSLQLHLCQSRPTLSANLVNMARKSWLMLIIHNDSKHLHVSTDLFLSRQILVRNG